MNRLILSLAIVAAACAAGSAVHASTQLKKRPVKLDPALGYVLVRTGPPVNAEGQTADLHIWRYDPATGELRFRSAEPSGVPEGEDDRAMFGNRPLLTGGGISIFITAVTPGEWVIHGSHTTCFCLGTYSFTVRPGEITDIGTVLLGVENGRSSVPELARRKLAADIMDHGFAINDVMLVRPAAEGDILPPEVAALPVRRAALTADVRFPNRGPTRKAFGGGLLINRAEGLPPLVNGDGAATVARLRDDPDLVAAPVEQMPKSKRAAVAQPE